VTTPDFWPRIERLYRAALAREESERMTFIREACGGDETLLRELQALLAGRGDAHALVAAAGSVSAGAAELSRENLVGRRLGPYEIAAHLGSGGMAEVYRARDGRLGREVAIKILPKEFTADADRCARFEREARLLAALNHPHIGAIYGLEQHEGLHALVLELVDGHTLAEILRGGPLPLHQALTIGGEIAEALEAAHDKGIVHRDLKPANIAITRDGMVKVLDFGIAKATVEEPAPIFTRSPTFEAGSTFEGTLLGTAAYMSPEQARGKPVDKRTDIWAFGCVLLEMLTARQPFGGETTSDAIAAILERDPDWSALPPATPPAIRRLLRRCLNKDARRRLHHIADARIEIEDTLREPLGARSESAALSGARWFAGRRRVWALASAAAALLLALVVGAALIAWRPAPLASAAPVARLMITLPAAQTVEKGRFPPVAMSPDGDLLVYAAAVGGGRTSLFLRPIDQVAARVIAGTEGASTPFFSPDGRWLAFYAEGALKKVPIGGGVPLRISESPPVSGASWGEDNRIVFSTTLAGSGLWSVSADGGEPRQITTPHADEAQHGYPQILPDGKQVLFSVRRGDAWQVALLSLEDLAWRVVGNGRVVGEGAQYVSTGHLVYAQGGALVATPFDVESGTLDQPPAPLLEQVETSRFGGAYFAIAARAGTLVYMPAHAASTDATLLRVDRDGRAAPLIDARAGYQSPAFSPDGRQLAVTIVSDTGSDVWLVDVERATRVRFTSGGASAFPVWGADGSRVAFQSSTPNPWNLFWKPRDGTSDPQPFLNAAGFDTAASWPSAGASLLPGTLPTLSGAGPQFPTSWTADGSTLAFHERKPDGERDIWTVSANDQPLPFLLTPFDEHSPRFSPNGRWLAYVSDEAGRDDVYVQPYPGPGAKWLVSTSGGTSPVWSKDGRAIFYRSGDQMLMVDVKTDGEFSAGRPRHLFDIRFDADDNAPNYDVSPDGRWFVMPRSESVPAGGELHLVLNWFKEVAARAQPATARQSGQADGTWASVWHPQR
jgi:Tol biopolymer transport system component/tRNA A-37 threonylcarbamoyl transferase component Bud32